MKSLLYFILTLLFFTITPLSGSSKYYTFPIKNGLEKAKFNDDSKYFFCRNGNFVEMWDTNNIIKLHKFPIGITNWWERVFIDINENHLMMAEKNSINIWDIHTTKLLLSINKKQLKGTLHAALFDNKGNILYSAESPNEYKIVLWDMKRKISIDKIDSSFLINGMTKCSSDYFLAYNENHISIYNHQKNIFQFKRKLNPSEDYINDAQCSSEGKSIYLASNGLQKININNEKMVQIYENISVLSISPSKKYIAVIDTIHQNFELRLVKTNQIIKILPLKGNIGSVYFSPDEKNILIGVDESYNGDKGITTKFSMIFLKL